MSFFPRFPYEESKQLQSNVLNLSNVVNSLLTRLNEFQLIVEADPKANPVYNSVTANTTCTAANLRFKNSAGVPVDVEYQFKALGDTLTTTNSTLDTLKDTST